MTYEEKLDKRTRGCVGLGCGCFTVLAIPATILILILLFFEYLPASPFTLSYTADNFFVEYKDEFSEYNNWKRIELPEGIKSFSKHGYVYLRNVAPDKRKTNCVAFEERKLFFNFSEYRTYYCVTEEPRDDWQTVSFDNGTIKYEYVEENILKYSTKYGLSY